MTELTVIDQEELTPNFRGDFYAVLGLKKGATAEEITKAYRRLVMRFHPDRVDQSAGPTSEQFRAIQNAYEVLGNKKRREFYDVTEGILEYTDSEVHDHATKLMTSRILKVCGEMCGDESPITFEELAFKDPMQFTVDSFHKNLSENQAFKKTCEKVIKKLEVLIKRFTKKNAKFAETLVGKSLTEQMIDLKQSLGKIENDRKVILKAIEYTSQYEYEKDIRPPQSDPFRHFGNMGQPFNGNFNV